VQGDTDEPGRGYSDGCISVSDLSDLILISFTTSPASSIFKPARKRVHKSSGSIGRCGIVHFNNMGIGHANGVLVYPVSTC
jgi:hypothetical protein